MRLMITQSYYRILDPKEENRNMPYPPLGSIILATYLEKQKYDIYFYDSMIASSKHEIYEKLEIVLPDLLLIYDDEFNFLTKMSLLNMRENTFKMLSFAKSKNIPVAVYTSDAIDHPSLYLKAGAKIIIIGEGETVMEDILATKNGYGQNSLINISGIVYVDKDNKIIKNEKKPLRSDLNNLPDPDFDTFTDLEIYRSIWKLNHGYFSLNISTSRGCTYGCNWCAKPLWGRVYNSYSPERIALLIENLKNQHQVDHIWITDDIFGLKKNWLRDFATICSEKNINVPYKCLSRADLLIKGDTVKYLKESGCEIIWIGAESGSQRTLNAMEKGITVEQIYEATKLVKSFGIKIAFFLQLGYLGEQWIDISKTRKLVLDLLPDDIGISISYPLPGTKFYNMVQADLSEKQNWTDSGDLDMLFHGTFSRKFYRFVHNLVHNEYRYYKTKNQLTYRKFPKLVYHRLLHLWYSGKVNILLKKESDDKINGRITLPQVA